ncbi:MULTISPECIES: hypothetical protein [unclassified Saccharicrinis]|uniref:hypothetical protein n=1 Tax=unclassified Saccharicrinis TaxID=2646859 RepID=UPI003D33761F
MCNRFSNAYCGLNLCFTYLTSANKFDDFVDDGTDCHGKHIPGIPDVNLTGEVAGSRQRFIII